MDKNGRNHDTYYKGQINETGNELDRRKKKERSCCKCEKIVVLISNEEMEMRGRPAFREWPFVICFLLEDGGMFRSSVDNGQALVFWESSHGDNFMECISAGFHRPG